MGEEENCDSIVIYVWSRACRQQLVPQTTKMETKTASETIYMAANCAAGLKKTNGLEITPRKMRKLVFVDPIVNPFDGNHLCVLALLIS